MTAQIHHYVSRCYLKGFAKHEEKPKIFVVDMKDGRTFGTNPINIAAERDFNRVDIEGIAPGTIESSLAAFETDLDAALTRVRRTGVMTDEDRDVMLNFIAWLAFNNPRQRENFRDFQERNMRLVMELLVSKKERWEKTVRRMRGAGALTEDPGVTYEEVRDLFRSGTLRTRVETPRNTHIGNALTAWRTILPTLEARKWYLLHAPDGSEFATSDHPVCLIWSDPAMNRPLYPPGFGMKSTTVMFPISRGFAMVGTFEGDGGSRQVGADNVAAVNGAIVAFAERQVYSSDGQFHYTCQPGDKPRRGVEIKNHTVLLERRQQNDEAAHADEEDDEAG